MPGKKIASSKFKVASDFRESRRNVGVLADSIEKHGLLQPIVVTEQNDEFHVVAGRRRFYAMTEYLKYEKLEKGVHFIIRDEVDPLIGQLIENTEREDFSPVEAARLVKAIHDRQVVEHGRAVSGNEGGWRMVDTGNLLGKDASYVSRMLDVAKNEDKYKDCKTMTDVIHFSKKDRLREIEKKVLAEKARRVMLSEAKEIGRSSLDNFVLTDGLSYTATLKDESIDLVMTDPPYGVGFDKIVKTENYAVYSDDNNDLLSLLKQLIPEYFRVLKDNKYCIIWCSFANFTAIAQLMRDAGFTVDNIPLCWVKLETSGLTLDPNVTLASVVEIAVYGWKGKFPSLTTPGKHNAFAFPIARTNRIHAAQKPESLITSVLNSFARRGDHVLDTFAGSGSTIRGCYATHCKFFGCEMSEEHYNAAVACTSLWIKEQEDKNELDSDSIGEED